MDSASECERLQQSLDPFLGIEAREKQQPRYMVQLAGQAEAQGRAVTAARRATQLSDTRYRNGLVSQLELLDARRSELRNRRQALQVKSAQYQAAVGLIRALGGGWDVPADVPADESANVPVAQATLR